MSTDATAAIIVGAIFITPAVFGIGYVWATRQWVVPRRQAANENPVVCSFCGKSQDEVRKLIAGPTVYICDECIDLCNDIIGAEVDQENSLGRPVASLEAPTWCRVCRQPRSSAEIRAVPDVGFVCGRCFDAIRAAVIEPKLE